MDVLKKLKEMNKGKKELSPVQKEAKMNVVKELRDFANEALSQRLKDSGKKVVVGSDSKEGLEAGLDKAKQMLHQQPDDGSDMGDLSHEQNHELEDTEAPEMEQAEEESEYEPKHESELSEDDLDKKIQDLLAKKAKMKHQKA